MRRQQDDNGHRDLDRCLGRLELPGQAVKENGQHARCARGEQGGDQKAHQRALAGEVRTSKGRITSFHAYLDDTSALDRALQEVAASGNTEAARPPLR